MMGTISAGVFLLLIAAANIKSDGTGKLEGIPLSKMFLFS